MLDIAAIIEYMFDYGSTTGATFVRSDLRLLQCLQDYYARHRAMPAFAEAAQLAGIAAVSTVAGMVSRLKGQGYLKATSTGRLQPGARFSLSARW